MSRYTILFFVSILSLFSFSTEANGQESGDITLIYIDNSNPSSADILRNGQLKALEELCGNLADKEGAFVMFLSDGDDSRIISSKLSIERFLSSLKGKHTKRPDVFKDVLNMRGSVYEKLNGAEGNKVNYHLFVTGSFMKNLNSGVNPLVELFPGEMEDLFGVKVKTKVHAPKSGGGENETNNGSGNVMYDVVYYD